MQKKSILEGEPVAVTLAQDSINERAGTAHWRAYEAAIKAGKSEVEAMQDAEAARREAVRRG